MPRYEIDGYETYSFLKMREGSGKNISNPKLTGVERGKNCIFFLCTTSVRELRKQNTEKIRGNYVRQTQGGIQMVSGDLKIDIREKTEQNVYITQTTK